MQARTAFRGTDVSKRGIGVALMALIVVIGALLAISFASAGSAKPSTPTAAAASTQPVGSNSDVRPHRANGHGALP